MFEFQKIIARGRDDRRFIARGQRRREHVFILGVTWLHRIIGHIELFLE